jgi:16S rRNA (guanine(966)-N(2))-methyltransferase RsmD
MDKMRESVFAILGDLSGASFLDLFSGSGIIALEAASRGAMYLEAVEADRRKLKILIANTDLSPVRIHCRSISVELYVKRSRRNFDYIFCDPPFAYQYKQELIEAIGNSPLVNNGSLLMIHRPKKEIIILPEKNNNILQQESRFYGNSAVDFFQVKN